MKYTHIDLARMTDALYAPDPYVWEPHEAKAVWSYIQDLISASGFDTPRGRDAAATLTSLEFDKMSQPMLALFHVSLSQNPELRDMLPSAALTAIDLVQPLDPPFVLNTEPRGIAPIYADMNIII